MTLEILTLLIVAIIVYPKGLIPLGKFFKIFIQGLGKLIDGGISLLVKIVTEILKLLGVLLTKVFELIASFFKWLISLF